MAGERPDDMCIDFGFSLELLEVVLFEKIVQGFPELHGLVSLYHKTARIGGGRAQ